MEETRYNQAALEDYIEVILVSRACKFPVGLVSLS